MQLPTIPKIGRLSKKHKITAAGAAAAAAVVLTVTGLQATGGSSAVAAGDPTGFSVTSGQQVKSLDAKAGMASQSALAGQATAQKKAAADAVAKKATADAAAKKATDEAAAKRANAQVVANRSTQRAALKPQPVTAKPAVTKPAAVTTAAPVSYTNNLDGWIKQSLDIMKQKGIPGSYDGIYRNVIRESSGNPNAINLWDSNAMAGIPSKGLLQVIQPTFQTYHVSGTSWNIYDPVANITAACNYAAHVYGSMDNVHSAY